MVLTLLVSASLLSACSQLDHGIIDGPTRADQRLLGAWELDTPSGPLPLLIGRGEAGTMVLAGAERHNGVCKIGYLGMKPTSIGGVNFAELSSLWAPSSPWIVAYEFTDKEHFALFFLRDDALTDAVKAKELPGEIVAANNFLPENTHVTASTAELRRFLSDHPEGMRWIGSASRQQANKLFGCSKRDLGLAKITSAGGTGSLP